MRSVLLVLLSTLSQCATSCPASCIVCSEDTIICHKLSIIIGVPLTTRALILTDGWISSVDNGAFSGLTNMTILGLSNNIIMDILNNAFQNLSALRTLLLDHNKITTSSILDSTFSQLQSLEILQLSNNALHDINGKWFQDMGSLLTLQLEGNLITRVESGTFSSSNLKNLETLDLSSNLIMYIAKESFHNLPKLHSLDLSRNSLHSAPDSFSSLPWLSKLNLVLNQWNCTCELWELSSFLRSYLQTPEKELYNNKQLVCLSSANSAIQNVVQLTKANCMAPNKNITVRVKIKNRMSMQQYIRDISLAATFFFAGGVGVSIGVMYCKMELSNNKAPWRDRTTDVGILNQRVPWWGFNDDKKVQILSMINPRNVETKLIQINEEETSKPRPWFREMARQDLKQARLDYCFVCHNCNQDGLVPSSPGGHEGAVCSRAIVVQGDSWLATMSGKQQKLAPREEDREHKPQLALKSNKDCPDQRDKIIYHRQYKNDFHMMPTILHTDAEVHGASNQNTLKPVNSLESMVKLNTFKKACDKLPHYEAKLQNIQTLPDYLITKCVRCSQTFEYLRGGSRERGKTMQGRMNQTVEKQYDREENTTQKTMLNTEDRINHKKDHTYVEGDYRDHQVRKPCIKPPQRRVSFDLKGSGALNNKSHTEAKIQNIKKSGNLKSTLKLRPNTSDENKVRIKLKVHSNSLLKVKINLNPFRKSRIHAQKNLKEILSEKNKKVTSTMAKQANLRIRTEKSDGNQSETRDTDTQKPPKKGLQNKLSQSTEMADSQKINTSFDDSNEEGASLVTSTKYEELLNHQSENNEAKQANSTLLYSQQDSHSDGLQNTVTQPQNNQINRHLQTDTADPQPPCSEMTGTSLVQTLTSHSKPVVDVLNPEMLNSSRTAENVLNEDNLPNRHSMTAIPSGPTLIQEYLPSAEGSPKRKIRLIVPERTSNRPQTLLDKKIR